MTSKTKLKSLKLETLSAARNRLKAKYNSVLGNRVLHIGPHPTNKEVLIVTYLNVVGAFKQEEVRRKRVWK